MLVEKALYRLTYMAHDQSNRFGDLLFKGDKYPRRVRLQIEMFHSDEMGLDVPREAIVRAVGVSSSGEGSLVCPDEDSAWEASGAPVEDAPAPLALYTLDGWVPTPAAGVSEVISVTELRPCADPNEG